MVGRHVKAVRAYTLRGGADYHDQAGPHWIDDHVATPMARYPEYRAEPPIVRPRRTRHRCSSRSKPTTARSGSWGSRPAVSIGAWIVEQHLARFVEGAPVTDIERIWDQMYLSTLHYGRKGIVLNAISGVDLALWDLLGQLRDEPVYALLGGAVRDELSLLRHRARPGRRPTARLHRRQGAAATRPGGRRCGDARRRRTAAQQRGRGRRRLLADARLLDVARRRLRRAGWPTSWRRSICAGSRSRCSPTTTGATPSSGRRCRRRCCSPPASTSRPAGASACCSRWAAATSCSPTSAGAAGSPSCAGSRRWPTPPARLVVPHGSSVYSYHFVVTQHNSPFAEFLMMSPSRRRGRADVLSDARGRAGSRARR